MLDEGRPGSKAGPAVRTARYPLSALGHAVGVVRILIDFQARTKAKWPCQLKPINLSVAWLFSNTRAGIQAQQLHRDVDLSSVGRSSRNRSVYEV